MLWPLKNTTPMFPDAPGQFGAVRKSDIHTGIDLYCELGQEVVAMEDGVVISIERFTGPNADEPSPWWNDTQAVLIKGKSGVIVYGEASVLVSEGDTVTEGQVIAVIDTSVLRSFKGRPMVMLHLELMNSDQTETLWWKSAVEVEKRMGLKETERKATDDITLPPEGLLDPTEMLRKAAGITVASFDLKDYDGTSYLDSEAPHKPSKWWSIWKKDGYSE